MGVAFGTDGIRGVANVELTPELALSLGRAAVSVLGGDRWLIGSDTRRSGPMLAAALAAGLAAAGADVCDLGVAPTPAVAYLAASLGAPAAVVSASHNPFADNGIKLLAPGGRKLADTTEAAIAAALAVPVVPGGPVGHVDRRPDSLGAYMAHVVDALEGRRLDGMRIVVDCANGAAHVTAPTVLRALGADVTALFADPDGVNINAGCGSTHPAALQQAVRDSGADAGLALDGDADRVLAVDDRGGLVDGDRMLVLCAADLHRRDRLRHDGVAVTVMSNLGLRRALAELGIGVVETAVGDRYVLEALDAGDLSLGGEQSGHVVFRDLATTGDGLLTGVLLLDLVRRAGRPLAELAEQAMTRFPQVLRNVRVADREALDGSEQVWAEVAAVEAALGDEGRVLLRPSGTEPLIRVMVEAPGEEQAAALADRIAAAVSRSLGPA
ncbi:MAG: phosphoglucosamine mutase [Acidimicrobiales bacterium]